MALILVNVPSDRVGEVQEVPQRIFDTLQGNVGVGVRHFTEIEEQVVQRLQDVMTALGTHQVHLLMRVVDALAWLQGHERHFTALVVGEVDEPILATQALFPRQDPATAQHAVDGEVAGVEAGPLDRHQLGQAEVELVGDDLAARGEVHGVADSALCHRFDHIAAGDLIGPRNLR